MDRSKIWSVCFMAAYTRTVNLKTHFICPKKTNAPGIFNKVHRFPSGMASRYPWSWVKVMLKMAGGHRSYSYTA